MIPTKICLLSKLHEELIRLAKMQPDETLIPVIAVKIEDELIPIDDPDIDLHRLLTIYEFMKNDCHDLVEERKDHKMNDHTVTERKALNIARLFASARIKHCHLLITTHLQHCYNRGKYGNGVFRQNESFIKAQRREHEQKERDIRSWAIFAPGRTDCNCSPPAEIVAKMISSGNL